MPCLAPLALFFPACSVLIARRLLRYLRYFQQEEYRHRRFLAWLVRQRAFDRRATVILLAAAGLAAVLPADRWTLTTASWGLTSAYLAVSPGAVVAPAAIGLLLVAFLEADPRKSGKVKLKMTDRAKRIWACALAIGLAAVLGLLGLAWRGRLSLPALLLAAAVVVQATPGYLLAANVLLLPGERRRQRRFREEAERRLREVSPYVIGITGSYGKTSTKAILGELLQALGPTLWPSGSINTPMGITRYVRENLRPGHRYAVFEMGAYAEGSIRDLCELVHPSAGIITTIGIMHLERFGDEEAVFAAKSELVRALPDDGILVLNADDGYGQRLAALHPRGVTRFFGLENTAPAVDCIADEIAFSTRGTTFRLRWRGGSYRAETPLLGRPALYNVLAAFTLAAELGADPDFLLAKIRNLLPQPNRLQLAKADNDTYYLHDAYNSNPVGFRAALEVLAALPARRRILMTPGMIELGPRQAAENTAVGAAAARLCDLVFIVGEENREALLAGLEGERAAAKASLFATTRDAFDELRKISQPGDLILIENDLPDLYDRPGF